MMWFRKKTPPPRQPRWDSASLGEKTASRRWAWRAWLTCMGLGFALAVALMWQLGMVFPHHWQKDYPWLANLQWARFEAAVSEVMPSKVVSPKVVFLPVEGGKSHERKVLEVSKEAFHYVLTAAYLSSKADAVSFEQDLEQQYKLKVTMKKILIGKRTWYRLDVVGPFRHLLDVHRVRARLAEDGYMTPAPN
jgi:hypothetical protein